MHAVSLRSYLTAGLAMTTAGAIAFAPAVLPSAPDVALPNISHAQVQLSAVISEADIQAFKTQLENARAGVDDSIHALLTAPTVSVTDALEGAIALNDELWGGLFDASTNPALDALIRGLWDSTYLGLLSIQSAVQDAANGVRLADTNDDDVLDTVVDAFGVTMAAEDVTKLLTSTLTGALAAATTAITAIINNPMAYDSYVTALTATTSQLYVVPGAVYTAANAIYHAGAGLSYAVDDLTQGVTLQAANIELKTNDLITAIGTASGSDVVGAVLKAVQAVSLTPLLYLTVAGANAFYWGNYIAYDAVLTATSTVLAAGNGLLDGVWAIKTAVDAIAAAPLDPASYVKSLGAVITGSHSALVSVNAVSGEIGKLPFAVAGDVALIANALIQGVVTAVGQTARGLVSAAGLGDLATAADEVVTGINGVVDSVLGLGGAVVNYTEGIRSSIDDEVLGQRATYQAAAADLLGQLGLSLPEGAANLPPGWVDFNPAPTPVAATLAANEPSPSPLGAVVPTDTSIQTANDTVGAEVAGSAAENKLEGLAAGLTQGATATQVKVEAAKTATAEAVAAAQAKVDEAAANAKTAADEAAAVAHAKVEEAAANAKAAAEEAAANAKAAAKEAAAKAQTAADEAAAKAKPDTKESGTVNKTESNGPTTDAGASGASNSTSGEPGGGAGA